MSEEKTYLKHGGDIYTEGKLKGAKLLDFSSNINFLGLPDSFRNRIDSVLNDLTCYPDLKYREIRRHIKEYLKEGIEEENLILGNGASEVIDLVMREIKKVLIVVPSYSEYEIAAGKYCEDIAFCNLNEDFSYNYKSILKTMSDSNCDGLVIGNPNNPNGGVIDKKEFYQIVRFCEEHNKRIIIDEAFVEFVNDKNQSFADMLCDYKCLFIIRAITKFFAMPGIRFGYGVSADKEFINKLQMHQIPWNINSFAEAAVKTVLNDAEYIEKSKAMTEAERKYFADKLCQIGFIDKVYESHVNFLLIKLKGVSGEGLFNHCISKGILIRRCRNYRGLDDSYIRLAVKSREDNNKLLAAFKNYDSI